MMSDWSEVNFQEMGAMTRARLRRSIAEEEVEAFDKEVHKQLGPPINPFKVWNEEASRARELGTPPEFLKTDEPLK